MNKEWIEKRKAEKLAEFEELKNKIAKAINESSYFDKEGKEMLVRYLENSLKGNMYSFQSRFELKMSFSFNYEIAWKEYKKWVESLEINKLAMLIYDILERSDKYLDSEPMEFDGDIIITDPCYIIRAKHHGTTPITDDDWNACEYGENMEALGINNYMTRDTLYGDWSCTTYNTDTKEPIGEFCADAGMVSVFLLDEVLKYNPDFDYHTERLWTTTLIKDFKGTVQFIVKHEEGIYEDTTEWHTKGDKWEDYSVEVVGHGINKITGEPINFVGTQTGL